MSAPHHKSPFSIANIRLFVAFRVFFNARFYYPVFTILFLDLGLTLEQFALLNVAWAATIVLFEVPSGALADTLGRRNLLRVTGVLMVLEMVLLCFVPQGNLRLLFGVCLVNRVLSGMAEAAASGADEALAYDSMCGEGRAEDWGRVLEVQMQFQSVASIVAMSLGAAVYDPGLMQRVAAALGLHVVLTQDTTLRFPLYLTLAMSLMALVSCWRMQEVTLPQTEPCPEPEGCTRSMLQAFRVTLGAGGWILKTPLALLIIASGLLFDHVLRMVLTLNSEYYRVIDLPEASFGLIGSAMAVLGLFMPRLARWLASRHSPRFNLVLLACLALVGLWGMTLVLPVVGLLPVMLLASVIYLVSFFVSHYLNRITDSSRRATVLSFKGLSYNLGYGLIGVAYSLLLARLRGTIGTARPEAGDKSLKRLVFIRSLAWFPGYFLLALAGLWAFGWWQLRGTSEHKQAG